jgi:hypothetical protein
MTTTIARAEVKKMQVYLISNRIFGIHDTEAPDQIRTQSRNASV